MIDEGGSFSADSKATFIDINPSLELQIQSIPQFYGHNLAEKMASFPHFLTITINENGNLF